jgi:hypothetical protein
MKLTIVTNFRTEYIVDLVKNQDDKVYFKRNLSGDKSWDWVNGKDVKYIKVSDNKSI